MKNKNIVWLIVIAAVTVILFPFAINIAYKQNISIAILRTEWDASAALTYYGSLAAAGIAVYGVFLTIRYSQKNYTEDVRNRTLPYLAINLLRISGRSNLDIPHHDEREQEEEFFEYKITDYYCILQDGEIQYTTGLNKEQQQIMKNGGIKCTAYKNGAVWSVVDQICLPIEIENVGNGAAVHFRMGLNIKEIPEGDKRFVTPLSLKAGEKIMLHIFSIDCGKESSNLGSYVLGFYYEDIYENKYSQEFDVTIAYDESRRAPVSYIDMGKRQEFIGGKK